MNMATGARIEQAVYVKLISCGLCIFANMELGLCRKKCKSFKGLSACDDRWQHRNDFQWSSGERHSRLSAYPSLFLDISEPLYCKNSDTMAIPIGGPPSGGSRMGKLWPSSQARRVRQASLSELVELGVLISNLRQRYHVMLVGTAL
jgi:hypothetical protein